MNRRTPNASQTPSHSPLAQSGHHDPSMYCVSPCQCLPWESKSKERLSLRLWIR